MVSKIFIIFSLGFLLSCKYFPQKPECYTYGSSESENEIDEYSSGVGSVDGYKSKDLYLVITNYKNNTMPFNNFEKLVTNYLDTLKPDSIPVGSITFLGQKPKGCIPDNYYDSHITEKYSIITFYFKAFNNDTTADPKMIKSVHFWKKGVPLKNYHFDSFHSIDSFRKNGSFINNQ